MSQNNSLDFYQQLKKAKTIFGLQAIQKQEAG
jgi:hypothetical protein